MVPFTDREFVNADRILAIAERVQESNQEFRFDEDMHFKVVIVNRIEGGKGPSEAATTRIINWQQWFQRHCGHGGCFLQIKNDDNLCLARSILTAKAMADNDARTKTIKQGDKD
uniref:Uncharacterized protein n=1 Tax=Romanomermis culicivorax TaxID=13658 RepID=A0A915IVB3_ROMCU